MAAIELNVKQRIMLDILLGQQRGAISEIEVFYDIKNKIALPDRDQYLRSLPTGEIIIDEVLAANHGTDFFEIEKEERRRLLELLVSNKSFSPSDLDWILPIKKQLERYE